MGSDGMAGKTSYLITTLCVSHLVINCTQSASAATIEQTRAGLQLISEYAEKTCNKFFRHGKSKNIEGQLDLATSTNRLVKKLLQLGFKGAVSYKNSEYFGPPRKNLMAANMDIRKCKLVVHRDLVKKIIPKGNEKTNNRSNNKTNQTTGNKSPIIDNNKGNITINIQ